MTYFETERLIARDWNRTDLPQLIELNADPEVMKYFLSTLSHQESAETLNTMQTEIKTYGVGVFAIEEKSSGNLVGFLGLHHFSLDTDFSPGVEIAWRFHKEFWNKGYATEAATACFKFAKEQKDLKEIYAFTSLPNKASARVMQKVGMQFVKEFDHPKVPKDHPLLRHVLYKIELADVE